MVIGGFGAIGVPVQNLVGKEEAPGYGYVIVRHPNMVAPIAFRMIHLC